MSPLKVVYLAIHNIAKKMDGADEIEACLKSLYIEFGYAFRCSLP